MSKRLSTFTPAIGQHNFQTLNQSKDDMLDFVVEEQEELLDSFQMPRSFNKSTQLISKSVYKK